MAEITVSIEGAKDSDAAFDDDTFMAADQHAYDAVIALYESGATVENVGDCVQRALNDADAAE